MAAAALLKPIARIAGRPLRLLAADVADRIALSRMAPRPLATAALRRAEAIDLPAIFADAAIARAWDRDHARIFSRWPFVAAAGSVNRGDCRAIYCLVAALKPERVVEIGTKVAGSSLFIAAALQSHGGPGARLTTVDIADVNAPGGPWSDTAELTKPPIAYAQAFGLAERIDFVTRPALDYLASAPAADLVFLDGSHQSRDVYCELSLATATLRAGGAILLHDYYPGGRRLFRSTPPLTGPYRAVERYRREGARFVLVPFGELPWPTRPDEGSRRSSLALMLG